MMLKNQQRLPGVEGHCQTAAPCLLRSPKSSVRTLVNLLRPSQARASFVCEFVDPPLRTETTGICVVPWEEAPGDPRAGLLGPSAAFMDCRHRS
jgi:hypothetical protein